MRLHLGIGAVLIVALSAPAEVHADEMDLALSRLRVETSPGSGSWEPDQAAWTRLATQLGFAVAPTLLTPARTNGTRGFYVGFETSVVGITENSATDFWARGTEGDAMSTFDTGNRFLQNHYYLSRIHLRKGLPFGFELGLSAGHPYNTDYFLWGAELKIAILEGFREGIPAFLPDIAVRAAVTTVTGDDEFSLTVPTFDIIVSKRLVAGGSVMITPIVGAQLMWTLADGEFVDLTPERNAFEECRPGAGWPEPMDPPASSTFTCTGSAQDFGNYGLFGKVRGFRARMVIGMEIRYRLFAVNFGMHWDLRRPEDFDDDFAGLDLARQWNFSFGLGLHH